MLLPAGAGYYFQQDRAGAGHRFRQVRRKEPKAVPDDRGGIIYMLERITSPEEGSRERIRIVDASFPLPFPRRLEYNAPAHGTWNIVHIGMAVPQSHSIYVCADNCLRGVVMTAAEMGCSDRFSSVTITERDLQTDNLETITIEGVSEVITRLPSRPPVVFVFLVCLHIFAGSDEDYIFRTLEQRWPEIRFVKAYMDCVRQKEGPSPDMKLRKAAFGIIEPGKTDHKRVNVLGSDVRFPGECELLQLLSSQGFTVRQLSDCETFQDYMSLGNASVNVCTYPNAYDALQEMSGRTGAHFLYLSAAVSFEEIRAQINELMVTCGAALPPEEWFLEKEQQCEEALRHLAECLDGCEVAIDYTAHSRPLGIARLLLLHGIRVRCVFLDQILEEEREAFQWLQEHDPDLLLVSTILPGMQRYGRGIELFPDAVKVVAFGQKAAWYCQTPWFVNLIEGGGLWGYHGILQLCSLLEDACETAKDYLKIIPRKGIGWPSMCHLSPSQQ